MKKHSAIQQALVFIIIHIVFGITVGAVLYASKPAHGVAFWYGVLVMTINIVGLGFIGWVTFRAHRLLSEQEAGESKEKGPPQT